MDKKNYFVTAYVTTYYPQYALKAYYFLLGAEDEDRCRSKVTKVVKTWKLATEEDEVIIIVDLAKDKEQEIQSVKDKKKLNLI